MGRSLVILTPNSYPADGQNTRKDLAQVPEGLLPAQVDL